MRLFNTFRTALELARRVEELERTTTAVVMEWGDVLDKLKAREERERKRKRSQILAEPEDCVDCGPPATPDAVQADKMSLWSAARQKSVGNGRRA